MAQKQRCWASICYATSIVQAIGKLLQRVRPMLTGQDTQEVDQKNGEGIRQRLISRHPDRISALSTFEGR
ncbi:hypothetical protein [Methylobacterium sp. J-090]|uniref:hypothetical protein n=1 Tax=Methylobacterium sp. J-090 TaxID=2836666 RepID=UPI001FBB5AFB|nr:hypothetical protein [Methylobacterium sp. J-090]MCJ2080726.1 hypothetical protein [Methylobacterium sp. J-090]